MKLVISACAVLAIAACSGSSGTTSATGTTGTHTGTTGSTSATTTSGGTTSGTHGATTSGASGTTGGSSSGIGTACTFDPTSGTDSCVVDGYECSAELTAGAMTGTCVLPRMYGQCTMATGCQDGGTTDLTCSPPVFQNQSGATNFAICLYPCTASTGCDWDPYSSCQNFSSTATDTLCFQNYCDLEDGGFVFDGPFFNACDAAGTGDGQCLPFATGSYALCLQTGTADAGALCSPDRGGTYPECVAGQYCVASGAADAGGNGVCMQISDQPDGSYPCNPTTETLVNLSSTDWGVCAQGCSDAGTCAGGFTCEQLSAGSTVCLP